MKNIEELQALRESEDKVEFKEAKRNFPFNGGSHREQKERRKCFLGYIVALANEKGGLLVLGMEDESPHKVVGSDFGNGEIGNLVDAVYAQLGIRVKINELYDEHGFRVLVTEIPSRPVGKLLKFEGVALMRTGESLRNMSDEEMFAILSEQEPDFSAKVCEGLEIADLDEEALAILKKAYAEKQKNPAFLSSGNEKMLSDLQLLKNGKLNYAALILLGKKEAIAKYLPQAATIWEFRFSEYNIKYDFREKVDDPLFTGIDKLWTLINGKNGSIPIRLGAKMYYVDSFNEAVIREALLNAITHRDYNITSEVLIKQYPKRLRISNAGGFPKGVTLENLITTNSTPRSRLMAEILEKTGFVERSGQGIDKIFLETLSEGKPEPNYSKSDNFHVILNLDSTIEDKSFYFFLKNIQSQRSEENRLNVEQVVGLYKVKKGLFANIDPDILIYLEREKLIKKVGTHTTRYILAEEYESAASKEQKIGSRYIVAEVKSLLEALYGESFSIGELEKKLEGVTGRNQIKYLIGKLSEDKILCKEGKAKGTKYRIADGFFDQPINDMVENSINKLKDSYDKI